MLKVVLVDDEEIIREGIATGFPWENLGFQVVGQAEDGEQALPIIEATNPDVIITDIKMPFIDGLKLIELVKPKLPQVFFIIISGHDEFKFAQKALKLGAYDYLLKPIDLNYLEKLLENVKTDYELHQKKEHEVMNLKQKIATNLPLLREHFFRDLLGQKIDPAEITLKLDDLKIDAAFFLAAIIQLDDYYIVAKDMNGHQRKLLEKSFDQQLRSICSSNETIVVSSKSAYEAIIVLMNQTREMLEKTVTAILKEIHAEINLLGQYTVTSGVGNIYSSPLMLAQSYQEALAALNYKFILGKSKDFFYNTVAALPKQNRNIAYYDETELVSALKLGDKKVIQEKLLALVRELQSARVLNTASYSHLQIVISGIFMQALKILKEAGGSGEEIFHDPLAVYQQIMSHQTATGMIHEFIEVLNQIIDFILVKRTNKFHQTIEKAREYLKMNFAKEGLSLEEVAKYVNMSPCYFSFTFKQETGTNFSDYLNNLRLEKAKELLTLSDCKSYEVSYMVGYNNPTYFSTIFKKHFGMSPTEYKNQLNMPEQEKE